MSLAEVFTGFEEDVEDLLVDVVGMDFQGLAALSRELEVSNGRNAALQARVMAEMARQESYTADGHSDVRGWYRATHKWSAAQATAMRRLSKLGVAAPRVLDELAAGRLGVFQAGVLARAFANPRVSEQVVGVLDGLFEHAANMKANEFEQVVDAWVKLVDADGSFDERERALDHRSASVGESDHSFVLRVLGPAIDGQHVRARWQRYIDAEWQLDWARCVVEHGDEACPARMVRTGEQRRYDAFLRMLFDPNPITDRDPAAATDTTQPGTVDDDTVDDEIDVETVDDVMVADDVDVAKDEPVDEPVECPAEPADPVESSAGPVAGGSVTCTCGGGKRVRGWPESVTNLMIDIATFERTLQRILRPPGDPSGDPSGDPPGGGLAGDGRPIGRPEDLRRWCSQTTDGRFIPPEDVVLEAIFGRVRLVVTDERGVVLQMGRKQRLFAGALRDAVMLSATCCTHPGCLTRASHSQADHLHPHSHGGLTDVNNGGPKCRTHNPRAYLLGLTTRLDQHGYWRTYRPDGTEI